MPTMSLFKPSNLLLSICIAFLTLAAVHADQYSHARKRIPPQNPAPPTIRAYANNPDFPDPMVADARLRQAWTDMWHLAAVACFTLDDQEELYGRYFEGGESQMVRDVFCNIAGIEDYNTCDLKTQQPLFNVNMKDLTIIAGFAQPDEIPSDEQPDLDDEDLEIFCTTYQDRGPNGDKAYTQMYKRSFDFPTLEDIFTKRTCSGLGQSDSGLMTSLGAHLLHEMMHWRALVRAENNEKRFDAVIPHDVWYLVDDSDSDEPGDDIYEEELHDYIDDYSKSQYKNPPANPETGYGPKNARDLVLNGNYASFRNADNYRWYAVSKYWSWKCTEANGGKKVVFGPQDDRDFDDSMIPEGCDGQVPCP